MNAYQILNKALHDAERHGAEQMITNQTRPIPVTVNLDTHVYSELQRHTDCLYALVEEMKQIKTELREVRGETIPIAESLSLIAKSASFLTNRCVRAINNE